MKVIIDPTSVTQLTEVGRRESRQRYYYCSDRHPALLLRTDGAPIDALVGQTRVALFDWTGTDSNIVMDQFPAAPSRWRTMQIVQCSLAQVKRLPAGEAIPLSQALESKL